MFINYNGHYVFKDTKSRRVVENEAGRRDGVYYTWYCSCGCVWEEDDWNYSDRTILKGKCNGKHKRDYIFTIPFTQNFVKFENKPGEIVGYNYIRTVKIKNGVLTVSDEKVNNHELHVSFKERRMWIVTEEGKTYKSRKKIDQYTKANEVNLYCASKDEQVAKFLRGMIDFKTRCGLIGMLNSFIKKFDEEKWLQILCYSDLPYGFIANVIEGQTNGYYYGRKINTQGKNPVEILKISKHSLKLLKERNYAYNIYVDIRSGYNIEFAEKVNEIIKEYDGKITPYRLSDVEELVKLGYDLNRLIKYVAYDIDRLQGITDPSTGVSLLYDTVRMHKDMNSKMYEKYPKSLKLRHDIAVRDYRVMEDEIIKNKFIDKCKENEYLDLKYENKDYTIIAPSVPQDLVDEGREMGHCVGSYVKAVANGKSKIFFLRRKDEPENSFVTVEITNGNNIIQVKARGNYKPDEEVFDFIHKWCKKKQLNYRSW